MSANISFADKLYYDSNMLAIRFIFYPDMSIGQSTEYEQMNRTDQTFSAIFDQWIAVIDAEFYGIDCGQCMEYVLRLCEALPVRIWMTHYNAPTPSPHPHTPQLHVLFNSTSGQTPPILLWHLSFCPFQGDKPQL